MVFSVAAGHASSTCRRRDAGRTLRCALRRRVRRLVISEIGPDRADPRVDLAGVEFLDSSALACLVRTLKALHRERRPVVTLVAVSDPARIILELTRLDGVVPGRDGRPRGSRARTDRGGTMTLLAPAPPAAAVGRSDTQAARVQSALATSLTSARPAPRGGDVRNLSGVGGDFVDFLRVDGTPHRRARVYVSGKGVAASLLAAMALGSLQHHAQDLGPHPARILRAVSSSMRGAALDRTSSIITLAIVAVDTRAGLVRLVSGRSPHDHARGSRRGEPRRRHLPAHGRRPRRHVERAGTGGTGSARVVVSDGVVDQEDPNGSPLGLAGLADRAAIDADVGPFVIVARTFDALENHAGWMPAVDDMRSSGDRHVSIASSDRSSEVRAGRRVARVGVGASHHRVRRLPRRPGSHPSVLRGDAVIVGDELVPFFNVNSQLLEQAAGEFNQLTQGFEFRVRYSFLTTWLRHYHVLPSRSSS